MANLMIEGIRWGDSTGIRIINKGIVDACVKQPVLNFELLLTTESIWFLARWTVSLDSRQNGLVFNLSYDSKVRRYIINSRITLVPYPVVRDSRQKTYAIY